MGDIGKTVVKRAGDLEVVCRELTVAQVRALTVRSGDIDVLGDLLFENVRLADLPLLTSLSTDQVEQLLPSALRAVIDGCKEANPDFFAMLARMSKVLPAS